MPVFLCYMPDLPDAIERRVEVRGQHQTMSAEAKARGENSTFRDMVNL